MGQRISAQNERSLTTTVSDIEHIESTSLAGISVIQVFFQPNANIQTAIAQVVAIAQTQLRQLPPGITPPLIIEYSASSIPVIQLGMARQTLAEQTVFERADAQARNAVATARRVLELANARYEGGATTYLDVITAQQSLLAAERLTAQLSGQRLLTSVFLIKALGGGWEQPARAATGRGLKSRRSASGGRHGPATRGTSPIRWPPPAPNRSTPVSRR